jgi:hypothetical protein
MLEIGADVAVIEESSGAERVYRAGTNAPPKSELPDEVPDEDQAPPVAPVDAPSNSPARVRTPSGGAPTVPGASQSAVSDEDIPDIAWPTPPSSTPHGLPAAAVGAKKSAAKGSATKPKTGKKLERWQKLAIVAAVVLLASLAMLWLTPDGPQEVDTAATGLDSPGPQFRFIPD